MVGVIYCCYCCCRVHFAAYYDQQQRLLSSSSSSSSSLSLLAIYFRNLPGLRRLFELTRDNLSWTRPPPDLSRVSNEPLTLLRSQPRDETRAAGTGRQTDPEPIGKWSTSRKHFVVPRLLLLLLAVAIVVIAFVIIVVAVVVVVIVHAAIVCGANVVRFSISYARCKVMKTNLSLILCIFGLHKLRAYSEFVAEFCR